MASVPSSSPTSDSQNSATRPIQPKHEGNDVATDNGVSDAYKNKKKADVVVPSHFQILESKEYNEKFEKYEAEYAQRLMSKYFSKNNVYGGNIFDEKTTIDDETIMSSRWPCTRSFADPLQVLDDQSSSTSSSSAETPSNLSNGNHTPKESG